MAETAAAKPKKFNPLNLVVLILIVLVVGGVVWYWHDHKTSNQTANSLPAGWSRYSNTKYGFEFIYPNDWGTPNLSVNPAEKGQSYAIQFIDGKLTQAQLAKQPLVSIVFDSQDLSRKVCTANEPTDCTTDKAFTASDINKSLSTNKSSLTAYDNNSDAIVTSGPTAAAEAMSLQQIVSLNTANVTAVRATYVIQNASQTCSQNKFSPDSMTGCITKNVYDVVNKVLKSIQNI